MDTIENIETVVAAVETPDLSVGKEIITSLAKSTAQTAGALVGVVVVYCAYTKIQEFRRKRQVETAIEAVIENAKTETPEN